MNMIPTAVMEVIRTIQTAGFKAYLVGGCVRDMIRGVKPHDYDVASSASPAEITALFEKVIPTGIEHGTVTVIEQGEHVEVTTFRSEGSYTDGRRPSSVKFETDIVADLARRDFTMNAIAFDPINDDVVDPFDGAIDISRKTIRCVGNPMERFTEDGLRPMRAIRFSVTLGMELDPATEEAIHATTQVFRKVAQERITQEFMKMLASPTGVRKGLRLLASTGLIDIFLPEADWGNFMAVEYCDENLAVQMAVLLYLEPEVEKIMLRLKFPANLAKEVAALTNSPLPTSMEHPHLRRWMAAVGPQRVDAAMKMHDAIHPLPVHLEERVREIRATNPPLEMSQLAIDGSGIMAALGMDKPGKAVGVAMRRLMDLVLEDPSLNTPDRLIAVLKA